MYKNAINGVDMVKIGPMRHLLPECEANFGKDYADSSLGKLYVSVGRKI
jgi:hypothetical protein